MSLAGIKTAFQVGFNPGHGANEQINDGVFSIVGGHGAGKNCSFLTARKDCRFAVRVWT